MKGTWRIEKMNNKKTESLQKEKDSDMGKEFDGWQRWNDE